MNIGELFLPANLEDSADGTDADWNAKALLALAEQLTVRSDFYYPLLEAAQELRHQRAALNSRDPVYSHSQDRPAP